MKPASESKPLAPEEWLIDGGEMGKLIRAMDWSQTPLGPRENWPLSLRTTVSLCLASNFPIAIVWGLHRVQLYNDGYWPICGSKHPQSMGQDFWECWPTSKPAIGSAFDQAAAGEAAFITNQRIILDRNGYNEETYFTFSFSPIRDETGQVAGLFHPVTELTHQTLTERRLEILRDLAESTADARTVDQAVAEVIETLAAHSLDLPFLILYRVGEEGGKARLAGLTGLQAGMALTPEIIDLEASDHRAWPLAKMLQSHQCQAMEDLVERFGPFSFGPFPEPIRAAMAVPLHLSGIDQPFGIAIAGVNPRRSLDGPYRTFYNMLRDGINSALSKAHSYEEERKRAEALAEIDRAKTVFFNNVSHEFRTPLTLMTGPLEEVINNPAGNLEEGERHLLETAHRNVLRLLKLVNSLLDFSRIEAGRIEANYTATDLATFTAELASVFRAAIEAAGLQLVVDCSPLPEPMFIDRDMWEKIILNLLSNAFKFTFTGTITVRLRWADGKAVLTVADTGTGVPPEHVPRLFERFHRVPNARGRTYEGSGIGLALVQELVKLHGGTISLESEVDRGTVFTLVIPSGTAHLPADHIDARPSLAPTAIGAHVFVEEALRWLPEEVAATVAEPAAGQSSAAISGGGGRRARILWADDNADMREYVRHLLAPYWNVETVADGLQALDAAQREVPDLVLSDVMMPNLDGFGLLKALRANEQTRDKPVILLSARAGEEARVEGMAAGADDYLVKPFSARELIARVQTHLELAAQRRELMEALRESEEKYRTLFTNMTEGFALGEPILDEQGKPVDIRYLEVNEAFFRYTGFSQDILGRPHRDFEPKVEQLWIDRFAAVALTGQPDRIENYSAATRRHYDVRAFSPSHGRFAILFWDITKAKENEEQLRNLAATLERRVAERTAELEKANEALLHSNIELQHFAHAAAHDLQTPLRSIAGFTQLLRQVTQGCGDEQVAQWTTQVLDNTKRLQVLIQGLLAYTRLEAQGLPHDPVKLQEVVEQVTASLDVLIRERSAHVQICPLPTLSVDRIQIAQVFQNLIENGIKYNQSRAPRIAIAAERLGDEWVFSVTDNGIGIDPKHYERIFDIFRRLHSYHQVPGSGIGLALCRRIVERHGGRIWVESRPGEGSTFYFTLPIQNQGTSGDD
ncbi:MAG: ATP-binding protein [Actinomycetota bacterium]